MPTTSATATFFAGHHISDRPILRCYSTTIALTLTLPCLGVPSGDLLQIYNYYDTCYGTTGITESASMTAQQRVNHVAALRAGEPFGAGARGSGSVGGAVNDYTCGGGRAMSFFTANPDSVKALHVKAGTKGMRYGPRDRGDLRPLYKELAQKYRVVIYSGDVDGCVPYVGTEEWTSDLGFPETETWRPWLAGTNQNASASVCAGYVTNYDAGKHNFTFITVKGAGHMVPEFKVRGTVVARAGPAGLLIHSRARKPSRAPCLSPPLVRLPLILNSNTHRRSPPPPWQPVSALAFIERFFAGEPF